MQDEVQALVHGLIREDAEARPRVRAFQRGGQGRDPHGSYRLNLEEDHGATYLELHGVVMGVTEEEVEVDFNHPLAGIDLHFSVQLMSVENDER